MSLALCHKLTWQGEKKRQQARSHGLQQKEKEAMGLILGIQKEKELDGYFNYDEY